MARAPARLLLTALVVALAVAAMSSCTDEPDERSREAAFEAKIERQHRAVSAVVVQAYEQGRLGPRDEVMAEVTEMARSLVPATAPQPRLFDADGNMVAYDRLDAGGRLVFTEWVSRSPRIRTVLGPELQRVRQDAEQQGRR